MTRVLFVCTGNLCRSPLAAGMWRVLVGNDARWPCDSAGIHAVVGAPPEALAQDTALACGADISTHRARQFVPQDYNTFDLLVALDAGHFDYLKAVQPRRCSGSITMLHARDGSVTDVPDPYRCSARVYRRVAAMLEEGLLVLAQRLGAHTRTD